MSTLPGPLRVSPSQYNVRVPVQTCLIVIAGLCLVGYSLRGYADAEGYHGTRMFECGDIGVFYLIVMFYVYK